MTAGEDRNEPRLQDTKNNIEKAVDQSRCIC